MPPSPSLSARITMRTYLTLTMRVMVQKISDRAPKSRRSSTAMSWGAAKTVWKA